MESLWSEDEARPFLGDPVELRAYTSRLLGADPSLVLHGGGNTSVKTTERDFFGDQMEVLWVKGSGWDLATIEPAGFSPVRLDVLGRMAALDELRDSDMVREQRAALLNPYAPNPSIEAVVHGLIPHRYVDHTHADAVITVSHAPDGEERIRAIYGDRVLVIPYVMPGFILAQTIQRLTQGVDWSRLEGLVLMRHGVFSFADDARTSYERMIDLVTLSERHLQETGAWEAPARDDQPHEVDALALAALRGAVSRSAGRPMIAHLDTSPEARGFAARADAREIATRGPVTPDHVIRTKRIPMFLAGNMEEALAAYEDAYRDYFSRHDDGTLACLDPAPRWAVWPGQGVVAFGIHAQRAGQISDISRHTVRSIQWGEGLGGWTPLGEAAIFEVEYWELEQAKLRKGGSSPVHQGRVALVTGAAGGIGAAAARHLRAAGAAVCGLDLQPSVKESLQGPDALGIQCDITDTAALDRAVEETVRRFGGLDILISNVGTFPLSQNIDAITDEGWRESFDLNVTSHMKTLRACAPFLRQGVAPAVVVVGSRNVPAPGPGVAAYSASKAALTQLARVAALEFAPGVRVNVLHPDKVFDTGLWDEAKLEARADHYGVTVEEYKRRNLLGAEVTADDVGALACAMTGPLFRCTTGAQVPVDGGDPRVV